MSIVNSILGSMLRAVLVPLDRRRALPVDGSLALAGLSAPVEVIRDRWGVPHIYAANLDDLFFAQGFVHAQDRLWQMELNRRIATGRLAELFGEVALDTDRFSRTFGFRRLAEADLAALGPLRGHLEAYAAGINACLDKMGKRLPVEFALLGHRPEPWTPLDTLAWARVMAWSLSHGWASELVRARLVERLGPQRAAELEIDYPPQNPVTLPQGIEFNRLDVSGALEALRGPFLNRAMGSNGWAVSGSRMRTGAPMLCNDMHLALQLPSIWYAVHLVAGAEGELYHASGVSLPGVPMVLVGHNAHIAWGMTLAFTDCEDLYVEKFDPNDPHRYEFRGEWRQAQIVREEIAVKGRSELHVEEVRVTHHGPVISDVVGAPEQRLALQSMALRPAPIVQGWFQLNLARGWDDFVEAMRLIEAPQLNVVYADVAGNIGLWVTGKVPLRQQGRGTLPSPGWSGEYEWVGEVPFEAMPHALNPAQGYVVSCNHRLVPDDYPYELGSLWMNGYRARRVVDVFEQKGMLSPDDFRALHGDFYSIPGREFAAHFQGLASPDAAVQAALETLCAWDGDLGADSVAGTLYEVTLYRLVHNLFEPALGQDLLYAFMGEGSHPLLHHSTELYGQATVTALRILGEADSPWLREAGGRQALLLRSLEEAVRWLSDKLGPQMSEWRWGRLHQAVFPHAMGIQPPLDRVFNRGPYPIGGDTDTVCQTAFKARTPYEVNAWAPSYRQIIDLGDLSRSLMMLAPGQSGRPGSRHYDDLIAPWLAVEYIPMLWTRKQVEREAEARLALVVR